MTIFWSFGGGTQTAAIAVLIKQGKLPMPDLIGFADTSREISETWEYLENVIRPAGFNVQIISHDYATVDLYRDDELLIPAFTRRNGSVGQMSTFCSNEWKQRVCRRWLKDQGVNDCDVWLGISTNELHRMKESGLKWYRHYYPLIQTFKISRAQCVALVESFGWPTPPKSRCYMCPMQSMNEWRDLYFNHLNDFDLAVKEEERIREKDPDAYLNHYGIPLIDAIKLSDSQTSMFDGCDSGYCMV